jgi:cytochrome c oxidase subunit 4
MTPTVSRKGYALTWLTLLGLTLLTTLLGFINMGPFSIFAAVGIAAMKAALIAGVFMHALFEGKLVRVAIAAGVIWFLILVTWTLGDYITRGWLPFPGK